jgi:hypothetical protein
MFRRRYVMGVGKYSPTVSVAYSKDQEWHRKLQTEDSWYDDEGYDSYGYHKDTEKDRAGYTEWDYMDGYTIGRGHIHYYLAEDVGSEWTFDGVRPVRSK